VGLGAGGLHGCGTGRLARPCLKLWKRFGLGRVGLRDVPTRSIDSIRRGVVCQDIACQRTTQARPIDIATTTAKRTHWGREASSPPSSVLRSQPCVATHHGSSRFPLHFCFWPRIRSRGSTPHNYHSPPIDFPLNVRWLDRRVAVGWWLSVAQQRLLTTAHPPLAARRLSERRRGRRMWRCGGGACCGVN
jgi:hypothetical protein